MNEIKPDLVLKNGSVYTVDRDRSWAQAVAIANDKIVFVGSNTDIPTNKKDAYQPVDKRLLDIMDRVGSPTHATQTDFSLFRIA